ncbi:MAG: FAD/NAD(P)-binding protein [candidate division Zixibacteria bacterium]|jgi:NAD(P)H-flavin reductase|nr:FAD/NAD(P)-binding protein [candidate division Zixibacteria bacterium]
MATKTKSELPALHGDADPMLTRPFLIRRFYTESHDTFSLELEPLGGDREFRFAPGQFNMLYVYGVGEVPISISGDPTKPRALVHTTREVGTVTRAMRQLRAGETIGVRGPYGSSWPVDEAKGRDVVLVTGGIGLAPLRPVIYYLLANREKYEKVVLLYGARTPEDILFRKDLEHWRSRFDVETHLTVDRASGSWRGNVGVVTQLIKRSPFDPLHCLAMVCGPEIMMRFTVSEFEKRGVTADCMYLSMERNMKCGIGLCGHCQIGPTFVCKDGPVYRYDRLADIFIKREM